MQHATEQGTSRGGRRVQTTLPADLVERLEAAASEVHGSVAGLVRLSVEAHLPTVEARLGIARPADQGSTPSKGRRRRPPSG